MPDNDSSNASRPPAGATEDGGGPLVASPDEHASTALHNLPLELSSFVGREREIVRVGELLADNRLLTLTGPGGSGKTRLALAVASEVAQSFEDGVWLVELAPLSDPDLVPQAVAPVLGVRETPGVPLVVTLCAHLASEETLLILDNCEHLIEACASLSEALLRRCQKLRILATSREALGVPGEIRFAVPPLSLPDPRFLPKTENLSDYEAAGLFAERARAVEPGFEITEDNVMAVAQICCRLDGTPLAIELAAARLRVLSAEQISSRLDDRFGLLTGGGRTALAHHRTLRATMDWSHDLLPEEERTLFRRLSVFAGGFALEAAEAVGSGGEIEEGEVLDLLTSLLDKSLLLAAERDGGVRYRLLETVRQYAAEKLKEAGEDDLGRRHAGFFLTFAQEAEPHLKGHEQVAWLERLEREHDNLRAAMRWLLRESEVESAVRLAWALWLFWYLHGHQGEGYRYTGELLDRTDDLPTVMRAKVLIVRGNMSYGREGIEGTERLFEEAAALSRQAGNGVDLAIALAGLGVTAMQRGDMLRTTALFENVLKLYREGANEWGVSYALVHLGMALLGRDDHAGAALHFEEALAISRKIGYRLSACISLYGLALSSRVRGDRERAEELYTEGLTLAAEAGDKANAAYCLEGLAGLFAERGEPERAVRLFGASEALLEAVGAPLYAHAQDRALYDSAIEALRSRLEEEAFGAAWTEGRAMTPERAVEYALHAPETTAAADALPDYPAGLSAREVEVLGLLAQGMTNSRIAEELFVSPRTVNAHLRSVYHKIGTSTRAEAARFATERGLL